VETEQREREEKKLREEERRAKVKESTLHYSTSELIATVCSTS
jgi:hypothetical protein